MAAFTRQVDDKRIWKDDLIMPMKIGIIKLRGIGIAEVKSGKIEISNVQDALDLMVDCDYQGARKIILHEKNIIPD